MSRDEEKRIENKLCPDGFPSLAEFIASHRDHSTAIYRHYDDLAARNLLYLQSELAELKALQDEYDREDAMPGHLAQPGRVAQQKRARDWREFEAAAGEANNQREKVRMELILKIRSKLKEYREALVLESQMLSFRPPTKQAHAAFCDEFYFDRQGGELPLLRGNSEGLYRNRHELIALARPAEEDRLTMMLRKYLPFLFPMRSPEGRRFRSSGRVASFSNNAIRRTVAVISICIAAALLYGAILNFYYVRNEHAVLGLIAVWTIAFALSVGLLTNAKRSEIFAACSAYAAVIVVFISNPLGSPNGGASSTNGTQCVCR